MSGVVLAAGMSKRLGGDVPKPLIPWEGRPLVRRIAEAALASRLHEVIVVAGHRASEIEACLADLDVKVVRNPRYAEGQSTSLRTGLRHVDERARAALFMPCDQPWLDAGVLDALVLAWRESDANIVVPVHRGRRGAPVLFDRSLFEELDAIRGDTGGRQILPAHAGEIRELELDSVRPLLDVDDEDDRASLSRAAGEDDT